MQSTDVARWLDDDNCFVIRFDPDGRCIEFTEWFMERPRVRVRRVSRR